MNFSIVSDAMYYCNTTPNHIACYNNYTIRRSSSCHHMHVPAKGMVQVSYVYIAILLYR